MTVGRPTYSAVVNASSKFSLRLVGSNVWYSNASGKKECTSAQKAIPSFQLEEKFCRSMCWRTGSRERRVAGQKKGNANTVIQDKNLTELG